MTIKTILVLASLLLPNTNFAIERAKFTPNSEVEKYLRDTLQVEDVRKYLLNRKLAEQLTNGLAGAHQAAFDGDIEKLEQEIAELKGDKEK